MTVAPKNKLSKSSLRKDLRARRKALALRNPSPDLCASYEAIPHPVANTDIVAGFSPIGDEIDVWPLVTALQSQGKRIALPVIAGPEHPLDFREWTPGCDMQTDRFGVFFPAAGPILMPQLILVPLLAFTSSGDRLGYGGGYYDRTLAALRQSGAVFACGVAYAGQEVAELPTDAHDAKLDGILTEIGFKAFA